MADAAQVVANQQRIFEGRRREMAGQIEVSLERIAQLKEEIGGLTSERVSAAEQSELALKELAVIEDMFARGYVNRLICKSLTLLFDRHRTLVTGAWIWRVTLRMCTMVSPGAFAGRHPSQAQRMPRRRRAGYAATRR